MLIHILRQYALRFCCALGYALVIFHTSLAQAFEFNLFGDALYTSGNHESTFDLGAVNLNAEQNIGESAYVTLELLFENTHHGFETDLERFSITNAINDNIDIKMGRFVEPLGFWNHNFHHASLSQDTVSRPFFLELEEQHEGVFPSHLVGAMVAGEYETWGFQFAIANNSGIDSENYDSTTPVELGTINFGDPSTDKTSVIRGTWLVFDTVELGLLFMNNNLVEMSENNGLDPVNIKRGDTLFEQKVVGFDYSYNGESFYTFGEYYQMEFTDNPFVPGANLKSYDANAFYLQFGYRITDNLTTAYRYENLDYTANNSTYFDVIGVGAETRHVVSFKYRIEESHALRLEINRRTPDAGESVTYYNLQWFFFLL